MSCIPSTNLAAIAPPKPDKPAMRATPEEIAQRPIPTLAPGQTLRLRPNQTMTLPPGQKIPKFQDTYTKDPDHGYCWGEHPDVTPKELASLKAVVVKHVAAFAHSVKDLPGYNGPCGPFEILLNTTDSIFTRPRRRSPLETEISDEKSQELVEMGILVPTPLPAHYASEVTCPSKKDEHGNWVLRRQCGDFRALNKHTIPDRASMPLPDDLFNLAGGCKFFSKLDLRSGFHQLPVHPRDQPKTSIWWRDAYGCTLECHSGS